MNTSNKKPKVMMHYVIPGALGGPNILYDRIVNSELLNSKYDFVKLNQDRVAGGRLNVSLIIELRSMIKKEDPDIIHISGMQSAGFHCMLAAFLAGCQNRIITTHGFSGDDLSISNTKRLAFNYLVEPLTLLLATKVHCISEYTLNKKMVKRLAKDKSVRIYNLSPRSVMSNPQTNSIRTELGLCEKDVLFTSISRIVKDKGYEYLAEAIKLTSDLENIKFLIVGNGKYENELKSYLRNEIDKGKVFFLGRRNDILDILQASDVFVLPTLHENLGNVFLEASVAGTPSIGTDVGGVPEIILHGETGLIIPPYDSKALADSIQKLYKNPELRKRMGQKANLRQRNLFNNSLIEKELDDLYSTP